MTEGVDCNFGYNTHVKLLGTFFMSVMGDVSSHHPSCLSLETTPACRSDSALEDIFTGFDLKSLLDVVG